MPYNDDNVFTSGELYHDVTYDPDENKTWWEKHWVEFVLWITFAIVACIAIQLALGGNPGLLKACIKAAVSGAIVNAALSGLIVMQNGGDTEDVIWAMRRGMVSGARDAFIVAAICYGVTAAFKAFARAVNSKKFYTVQSADDIARLKSGGEPWPTGTERALLGEGTYAWGSKADAKAYLLGKGAKGLKIYKFRVNKAVLSELKTLNIVGVSDDLANQLLYDVLPTHGYQHVIRATGKYGIEYFFDKSVMSLLKF